MSKQKKSEILTGIGPSYQYRGIIHRVYDGDTIKNCEIDLGLDDWHKNQEIRFYGIDTPEIRQRKKEKNGKIRSEKVRNAARKKAYIARDYARSKLPVGTEFIVQSREFVRKNIGGKYGRIIGIVFYPVYNEEGSVIGHINLNEELLHLGYAKIYKER